MGILQLLQFIPGPLLRLLDAWSHQVALRRQRERRQRWLQRTAPAAAEAPVRYKLQLWRD